MTVQEVNAAEFANGPSWTI